LELDFHPTADLAVTAARHRFDVGKLAALDHVDVHREFDAERADLLQHGRGVVLSGLDRAGLFTAWDAGDEAIDVPEKTPNLFFRAANIDFTFEAQGKVPPEIFSPSYQIRLERASRAAHGGNLSRAGIVDDHVFDVLQFLAEIILQAFFQTLLDLPHALAADAVALANLAQRERLFVKQSLAEDDQILVLETARELLDLLPQHLAILRVGDALLGVRAVVREKAQERGLAVFAHRHVRRDIAVGEPLLHLDDFPLFDVEPLGEELRPRSEAFSFESFFFLLEIKKELALGLCRPDLDHAPVVDEVADDISANPPDSVRRKADAAVRVEILDSLHEADVPFLNKIEKITERALIFARDHHDEPQVRRDELVGCLDAPLLFVFERELVLFLAAENGITADFREITLQRVGWNQRVRQLFRGRRAGFIINIDRFGERNVFAVIGWLGYYISRGQANGDSARKTGVL